MFHRVLATVGSQASSMNVPDQPKREVETVRIEHRFFPIHQNSTASNIETTGIFEDKKSVNRPLFPHLSGLYERIHSIAVQCISLVTPIQWPPRMVSANRDSWVRDTALPLLPPGRESRVTLARLDYPLIHLRCPIMGPQYMHAISILTPETSPPPTPSSNPADDEENIRFDDNVPDTSWYLPDVDEEVNFGSIAAPRPQSSILSS